MILTQTIGRAASLGLCWLTLSDPPSNYPNPNCFKPKQTLACMHAPSLPYPPRCDGIWLRPHIL